MPDCPDTNRSDVASRDEHTSDGVRRRRLLLVAMITVAALFSGVVGGVMISAAVSGMHTRPPDRPGEVNVMPDSRLLRNLRELLRKNPQSEEIKEAIRREDLRLRRAYFSRKRTLWTGTWLLVAGLGTVLVCLKMYVTLSPSQPKPESPAVRNDPQRWRRNRKRMMAGVGGVGFLVAGAVLTMIVVGGPELPSTEPKPEPETATKGGEEETPAEESTELAADRYQENWPRFRGPGGMGVVDAGDWPTEWDGASGKNVVWKTEVPAPGNSSPVIWGGRIFLTGGTEKKREVLCFAREDGRLLWRTEVPTPPDFDPSDLYLMDPTGYAAPTAVTDGERVYAFFATADLAAVDFEGNLVWNKHLGDPNNTYGIAVSPIFYGGQLILQFDRGTMPEDELSRLIAFDPKTGEEEWSVKRPVVNSWSTPVVAETETGTELITSAAPWVISYDPEMGTELWRAKVLSGDVAPCPVVKDSVAYVTNEYAKVAAIQTGGVGDVTDDRVKWTAQDGMSDAPSPICDGDRFLQIHSRGRMTCYDAEDGELLYDERLDSSFWASPTLVGTTVYLPSAEGRTYLFEFTDKLEISSTHELGEPILATPAFADSFIYIRGENHLFCIGEEGGSPTDQ